MLEVLHHDQIAMPGRFQGIICRNLLLRFMFRCPPGAGRRVQVTGGQECDDEVRTTAGHFLDQGVYQVGLA